MRFRRVCKLEGTERSLTLQSSHSGPSSRFISLRIRESKDQKIFQARTRFINLRANCRCLFQTLYACSFDPFSGNWFGEIKPWGLRHQLLRPNIYMMTQSLEAVTAKIVIYQKLQMLSSFNSFNGLWILFFLDIFGFFSPLGYPSPMYGRSAFNDVLPSHASFLQPSTKLVVYCFGSSTRIITSKRALINYPLSLPPQLPALPRPVMRTWNASILLPGL